MEGGPLQSGPGESGAHNVQQPWLWQRTASLDPQVRQTALSRAGLASSAPAAEQQPSEDAWGFATRVPALDLLFARAQQATASTDSLQPISGHVTSAKGTPDQLKHHKSGRKCERVHQACLESSDLQLGLLCRLSGSFACQSHFPVPRLRPGNGRSVRHAVPAVIPAGLCNTAAMDNSRCRGPGHRSLSA